MLALEHMGEYVRDFSRTTVFNFYKKNYLTKILRNKDVETSQSIVTFVSEEDKLLPKHIKISSDFNAILKDIWSDKDWDLRSESDLSYLPSTHNKVLDHTGKFVSSEDESTGSNNPLV